MEQREDRVEAPSTRHHESATSLINPQKLLGLSTLPGCFD